MKKTILTLGFIGLILIIFFVKNVSAGVTMTPFTKKVCLEGHVYFYGGMPGTYLAIKLDDNGKPIKCEVSK